MRSSTHLNAQIALCWITYFLNFHLMTNNILKNMFFYVLLWKKRHLLVYSRKDCNTHYIHILYLYELDIMNYWLPALHVKISVAGQLCPWGDSKALISQVLEYIKSIKLHLYFPASNCNNTMSYQLFSDHHTCRIYLTRTLFFLALVCSVETKLFIQ